MNLDSYGDLWINKRHSMFVFWGKKAHLWWDAGIVKIVNHIGTCVLRFVYDYCPLNCQDIEKAQKIWNFRDIVLWATEHGLLSLCISCGMVSNILFEFEGQVCQVIMSCNQ